MARRGGDNGWVLRTALLLTATGAVLSGCRSVVKEAFQATYDEVMRPADPLPAAWLPDVSLRVSHDVVERALMAAIEGSDLSTYIDLPIIDIEPRLGVDAIQLVDPFQPCSGCLGVIATFSGEVAFKALGRAGRTRMVTAVTLDTRLEVAQGSDGWVVTAAAPRVYAVDTQLPLLGAGQLLDLLVNPLTGWVSDLLSRKLQPIRLAHLGNLDVPVRALRVEMAEGVIELQARTFANQAVYAEPAPDPGDGWSVRMPAASVLALARTAMFQQGTLGAGIWADPRDLSFEDDRFELSLRLWRVGEGLGWWRDYRVTGDVAFDRSNLSLQATDVDEVAHSEGAGLADPLAAMLKSRILDIIAHAVTTQVPTARTEDINGTLTTFDVRSLSREGEDFVIRGGASFDLNSR